VNVNVLHVIYLAKLLLPQLVKRCEGRSDLRSGVVIVSSGLGCKPIAGITTYSCTKSFVSFLSQGLNFECKSDKVDVMGYEACEVKTNLLQNESSVIVTISPERAVSSSFKAMGLYPITRGAVRHEFQML